MCIQKIWKHKINIVTLVHVVHSVKGSTKSKGESPSKLLLGDNQMARLKDLCIFQMYVIE